MPRGVSEGIFLVNPRFLGAKQYGLRLRHLKTNQISHEMKLRGIKQTIYTDKCLPYDEFVKKVKNFGQESTAHLLQNQFMPRLAEGRIFSKIVVKDYDVVLPKGCIDDTTTTLDVFPNGY